MSDLKRQNKTIIIINLTKLLVSRLGYSRILIIYRVLTYRGYMFQSDFMGHVKHVQFSQARKWNCSSYLNDFQTYLTNHPNLNLLRNKQIIKLIDLFNKLKKYGRTIIPY